MATDDSFPGSANQSRKRMGWWEHTVEHGTILLVSDTETYEKAFQEAARQVQKLAGVLAAALTKDRQCVSVAELRRRMMTKPVVQFMWIPKNAPKSPFSEAV